MQSLAQTRQVKNPGELQNHSTDGGTISVKPNYPRWRFYETQPV